MKSKRSHSIHVMETPVSTVTSGGHWFYATSKTVDRFVPGLLKEHPFEKLISKAVTWIDSADSLAMLLFFVLAFIINVWIAALVALLFHVWWYFSKSAFVTRFFTPLLKFFNYDIVQLTVAAVVLSFMGINGMYTAVVIGIIFFFLFKIGLLRRLWDRLDSSRNSDKLPLNDRVLKMILIRYAMYENMPPPEVKELDQHVQNAVYEFNKKRKKK